MAVADIVLKTIHWGLVITRATVWAMAAGFILLVIAAKDEEHRKDREWMKKRKK